MNTQDLLRFWGKTDKNNSDNYHPLLFHLLDVGHVTQRLWTQALSPRLRHQVAQALGLDDAATTQLVVLLAAQHDLGKASAFQRKDTGLWNRLGAVGLTLEVVKDRPHGYVSAKALPNLAQQGIGGWSANAEVARGLAQITGGHHGTFPTSADLNMGPLTLGGEEWNTARADLLQEVCRVFYAEENLSENPILCPRKELTDSCLFPLLGGLISVADWIGSSSFFPPAGPISLSSYVLLSQKRAEAALKEFGWMAAPRFAAPALFREIFPFTPNRMQQKTVEWTSAATDPYLLIIEAAMGDGKTEAALYAADQALATDQARGFYIALPTQATGNAMFQRVQTYLEGRGHGGPLNLQLVHAGAFLSEEFEDLQQAAQELKDLEELENAQIYDDNAEAQSSTSNGGQAGRVVAESWFTARKRPLLARFGVGTIDQSLLGALQTKHWFVRLLGLAGKVVIFDEVHAYDIYMSTLLCRLLRWLRVLDCTVLLLSATLPASARQELVTAWAGEPTVIPDAEYPRLTICAADVPPNAETVADPNPVTKTVALGWTGFDWESVWDRLHSDLPNGGGALLLCNTVTRAQDAYACLAPRLTAEGWTVKLFHARTPVGWRQKAEKEVLATFGKTSDLDRRRLKTLLIATSIVEQSLNIDFDWIATEMAPADLLLQRMGRLWRHPGRQRSVDTAQFIVLCGAADTFPVFQDYAELIYDRFILLRSWLALQKRGRTLILPAAIDALVQEVYNPAQPENLPEDWQAALTEAQAEREHKKGEHERKARAVLLPPPEKGPDSILRIGSTEEYLRKTLWEDDDPRVHETVRAATRLGDPSVGVICTGTDEYGEPLAEMPANEPNLKTIRKMLWFGLPLSRPIPLFRALIATDAPDSWKESSLLRYHREIKFTRGRAAVDGYDLRLSRAEGLIIQKQGTGTEE